MEEQKDKTEEQTDEQKDKCNIVLSFIGKLPPYIIECIHQIRLFFSGPIYLILNDFDSPLLIPLEKYSVQLVQYDFVLSTDFSGLVERNANKFIIDNSLGDRKELFIRSFERFFLLQRTMYLYEISNVIFLEIDVLIYNDPFNWIDEFSQNELCYTFDNVNRCSGAFMYIQTNDSLSGLLDFMMDYIDNHSIRIGLETLDEMTCLYHYYKQNPMMVELLPIYWHDSSNPSIHSEAYMNYSKYNVLFDAISIGCNMIGGIENMNDLDVSGNPVIKKGSMRWSNIDYSKNRFQFIEDSLNRKIPSIWNEMEQQWKTIQNLHVHSKELRKGLSKPL